MVSLDGVGVMIKFIRLNPLSQSAVGLLQRISFVQLNGGIKICGVLVWFSKKSLLVFFIFPIFNLNLLHKPLI